MDHELKPQVERFAKALALALYDKTLEMNDKEIVLYLDADVIFKMVLGLEGEFAKRTINKYELLVRALFSSHLLGEFYVLDPHAYELNELLRRQASSERVNDQRFQYMANEILRDNQILDTLSYLNRIIKGNLMESTEGGMDRTQEFVAVLREIAGEAFAYIEQTNGAWWQRIKRYYDERLIRLDRLGHDIRSLQQTNEQDLRTINRALQKRRPRYSFNAFEDALALTILHKLIKETDDKPSHEVVRFYTETGQVRSSIRDEAELRSFLSYEESPVKDLRAPTDGDLVLRDSDYFIVRAWFQELSPGVAAFESDSLADLKRLSNDLDHLAQENEDVIKRATKELKFGEREIINLIESFEKLTIMEDVWTRGGIVREAQTRDILKNWKDVFDFAQSNATKQLVNEQIESVLSSLESKVGQMSTWTKDYKLIYDATHATQRDVKGKIKEPSRDLGLIRWGCALSEGESTELTAILNSLLEDEMDLHVEVMRLATSMEEARAKPDRCMLVCGALWAIRSYSKIVETVSICEKNNADKPFPISLHVIRAAAEAKAEALANRAKRQESVARVLALLSKAAEEERKKILLGVGYVLYQAWKLEMGTEDIWAPLPHNVDEETQDWALTSFRLGEEAFDYFDAMPDRQLERAFAINHCAYVGTITGVESTKTSEYVNKLINLEGNPQLWTARFDDTLGCHFLRNATKMWYSTIPEERVNLSMTFRNDLVDSGMYFEDAIKNDIGDTDVRRHRTRLRALEDEYSQLKKGVGR